MHTYSHCANTSAESQGKGGGGIRNTHRSIHAPAIRAPTLCPRESQLLKRAHVPRLQGRAPQQHPPPHLQRPIQPSDLPCRRLPARLKPIHAIHQHRDRQRARRHPPHHLVHLIRVDAQPVKGAPPPELPVRPRPQILRVAGARVAPLQTHEVVRILLPDQRRLDHRVQRPHHVLPHRAALAAPELRLVVPQRRVRVGVRVPGHLRLCPRLGHVVRFQHPQLVPRHAERLPEEGFLGHDEVGEEPAHDDGADLPAPDVPLFGERGCGRAGGWCGWRGGSPPSRRGRGTPS
ncbi:hypothetical protein EYC84_004359 [Monilinia fructicola]|uniref:Uncharacterized protein n=1 Tax=Monilinia fructicola TaxID=38448 RepID=A0A5M9K031_MONFR|nr:hypothetical protein EYC84_004359 [Monilinia fructicola]